MALVGYFQANSGTINQIIHMWKFADDADRRAFWARLYTDKEFMDGFRLKFHPLVMTQEVKVVVPAPWGHHP